MNSREELERHAPRKVSEIESRFREHVAKKYPGYDKDALEKWHMRDVRSPHHPGQVSNTMIETAKKEGWL